MDRNYLTPTFLLKVDGEQLAPEIARHVATISVTRGLNEIDHCDLTIANPYPELPWTHGKHADLFVEGATLELQLGYVDALRPMLSGKINRLTLSFPESDTTTISVGAQSELYRLHGQPRTRSFTNVTDSQIADQVVGASGLRLEADETTVQHEYVLQHNQSDLWFLTERARRIGFILQIEGKTVTFKRDRDPAPPHYTLVWGAPGQSIGQAQKVMPLKRFEPTLNLRNQVSEVIVRGQHPTTRELITARAGAGDETQRLGRQSGPEIVEELFGPRSRTIDHIPVGSQQEATGLARAELSRQAMQLITGHGATIGLPDLRVGATITLEGLGPRFSGVYAIVQVTHTINQSGYQTEFIVQKNGLG